MRSYIAHHLNKNDNLLKHSILILIGSTIANFINYLYQLFMGRFLGPSDYSVLGALFSIVYIVSFSFGAVKTVVMRFTSKYFALEKYGKIKWLLLICIRKLLLYAFIGFAIFFLVSPFIASFLKISPVSLVILSGLFLFLSFLTPVPFGVINGLQKFIVLNVISVLGALLKLGLGVLAIFLGMGVFGAMIALDLSQLLTLIIPFFFLFFLFRYKTEKANNINLFSYSIPVFIGLTVMNLFVNIDVLMVKHYFPSLEAGYYTAASVIGKIILFGSGALLMVMFPKVSFSYEKKEDSSKILRSTMFYTILIAGLLLILYYSIPTFISRALFGSRYDISGYVGIFGLVLGIFSISSVLVNYNLAVKKTSFVYFLMPLLLLEIMGIVFFHNTLLEVIQVILVVNVIILGYMLFVTRKEFGINMIT